MAETAQSRNEILTTSVQRICSYSLEGVREAVIAAPNAYPEAVALAQKFYPRSSLARGGGDGLP
jgi:hypothetical protein